MIVVVVVVVMLLVIFRETEGRWQLRGGDEVRVFE